jgi:transcriptional regulator with XRE-family HTH domain
MREAMKAAKLTIKDIAEELSIARSTVHRWYTEERIPDAYLLERFAAQVGKAPEYFWASGADEYRNRVTASIVRVLVYLAGDPPMPAINALSLEVPRPSLSPREQTLLEQRADFMRATLQALADEQYGKPWERLNYGERASVVEGIMRATEPEE